MVVLQGEGEAVGHQGEVQQVVAGIGVGEEAAELVPLLLGVEAQRPGDEAAGQRLPGLVAEALVALGGVDAQQADFLLAALEPDEQGVAVEDLEDLDRRAQSWWRPW